MNAKTSMSLSSVGQVCFNTPWRKSDGTRLSSENGVSFPEAQKSPGVMSFSWWFMWVWDFLWVYSSTPESGSCWPSFILWLLVRRVTGPNCQPKVNWLVSARDPLIMANLPDFTLPTVIVHHNIPSTSQKGSSKMKCGVSQGGWWGMTANLLHGTLPPSHTSCTFREGRIEGRKPRQVPLISLRSEVTFLMSISRHVPWRDNTVAAIVFWVI